MSKLKLAGPALLYVVFLVPCFGQNATASLFAKQVESGISALSSQPTVGAWQKLHANEKLELAQLDDPGGFYERDLSMEFLSWCAASISQSPSTFGRVALFLVPSVKADAVPPVPSPGLASVKEDCRMQALDYSASPEISMDDLVREFSSVWGAPTSSPSGPLDALLRTTVWDHAGFNVRLEFRVDYGPNGKPGVPLRIVLYAKRVALQPAACFECRISLMYPLLSDNPSPFIQRAAEIAAQDPALTRQIVSWSGQIENPKWGVKASLARDHLGQWLEAAKQRSSQQRAAALLLADLYIERIRVDYAAKPDVPFTEPVEFYKGLGAEYYEGGAYAHNFLKRAEKMDGGGEVSELAALWTLSESCPDTNNRLWPDAVIERGESFLSRFSSDQWSPYAHWALAMAHGAKLAWTYPGGDNYEYDGKILQLSPAAKEHERAAAIEHFKAFLDARPGGPEAAFAWTQTWRLLAGLPPTNFGWGCTGE